MADEPLDPIATAVVSSAERLGVRYMVTGMYAGNHWLWGHGETRGFRRPTGDVDFSLMAPRDQVAKLAAALQKQHGWERARETHDQLLLRDPATGFQADLLKAVLPEEAASPEEAELAAFFRDAYERSETRTLGGREMRLQRPEDIITVKVLLGRPKDIRDIRLLDRLPSLDRRHLARWLGRLGLIEAYRLAVGAAR